MKASEFLKEFDGSQFPDEYGPWIAIDSHDPPFTMSQLKRMEKQGIIVMDTGKTCYKLTLKATEVRRKA
jgi:hypothetical protein